MSLGLMMIVKDEEHVIERCLSSVRDHIDWWVIADTGSSDNTKAVIERVMAGVPGVLVDRDWVNFGHNRQQVLDLARDWGEEGDYVLWLDADEQFITAGNTGLTLPEQQPDGFYVPVHYDNLRYQRLAIIALDALWRWEYPVHEYLTGGESTGFLETPHILVTHDGARAKDPETYIKDANLCYEFLARHPDDPRMQFYYAQSLKDAGLHKQAREAYRRRAENPAGWDQERWYAMYQHALLRPPAHSLGSLLDAYEFMPSRAEPLVEAARRARAEDKHHLALLFASQALAVDTPGTEALFVDLDCYEWGRWDELAMAAYYTGDYRRAFTCSRQAALTRPEDARLQENYRLCVEKWREVRFIEDD